MEDFTSFACSEEVNEHLLVDKNKSWQEKKAILNQLIEKGRLNHEKREDERR